MFVTVYRVSPIRHPPLHPSQAAHGVLQPTFKRSMPGQCETWNENCLKTGGMLITERPNDDKGFQRSSLNSPALTSLSVRSTLTLTVLPMLWRSPRISPGLGERADPT
jgi:hypothetical protein